MFSFKLSFVVEVMLCQSSSVSNERISLATSGSWHSGHEFWMKYKKKNKYDTIAMNKNEIHIA